MIIYSFVHLEPFKKMDINNGLANDLNTVMFDESG